MSVEKTLLDVGKPTYDEVIMMLRKDYHCYLPDCYEHPEYLRAVIKKLYGNSCDVILGSIREKLEEFEDKQSIREFVSAITQQNQKDNQKIMIR